MTLARWVRRPYRWSSPRGRVGQKEEEVSEMRQLIGPFVIAHGLVTMVIWIPNPHKVRSAPPMDTSHSWLLGDRRRFSLILAVTSGLTAIAAGLGLLAQATWWVPSAILAWGVSLLLFGIFFSRGWLAGIAISTSLLAAAIQTA